MEVSRGVRYEIWEVAGLAGFSSDGQDMTEMLAKKKCTRCRGGVAPLTREEAAGVAPDRSDLAHHT